MTAPFDFGRLREKREWGFSATWLEEHLQPSSFQSSKAHQRDAAKSNQIKLRKPRS
jgi:hypothetical protein